MFSAEINPTMHFFWMRRVIADLAYRPHTKFNVIPPISFNSSNIDTEKNCKKREIVIKMKISSCKNVIGNFIHMLVYNHILNAVVSGIRKRPQCPTTVIRLC